MKNANFHEFSKKYWRLYLLLCMILLLSIFLYLAVFCDQIDAAGWASLVSGIFTYIGSIILGLFVFYNSWLTLKTKEWLQRVNIDVDAQFQHGQNDYYLYPNCFDINISGKSRIIEQVGETSKISFADYVYLPICIKNRGYTAIDSMLVKSISISNGETTTFQKTTCIVYDEQYKEIIDYKDNQTIYIGILSNLFENTCSNDNKQQISFVIELHDKLEKIYYYTCGFEAGMGFSRITKQELLDAVEFEGKYSFENFFNTEDIVSMYYYSKDM